MKHLKRSLGRPQISELSDYLNKYFKQSRRRKFETMNQNIVRKTEPEGKAGLGQGLAPKAAQHW